MRGREGEPRPPRRRVITKALDTSYTTNRDLTALDAYEGTLLLVTHDRQLLEAVAVDRTVELGRAPAVRP